VHADFFDNPSARYADILLPAATSWEREGWRGDRQGALGQDAGAAGIYVRLDPPRKCLGLNLGPERLGLGSVAAPSHLGAALVANLNYGCHSVATSVANP